MSDRPHTAKLIWHQIRYQNKIFWRTPIAAFFTLVFPLMFLVLFTAIFGNDSIDPLGVTTAQFYAPGLAVFAAVSASYTNLAIGTAYARDNGILKRVRGTPLPPWVYIAGRIGSATYLAALAVVLMMGVGVFAYGVVVYADRLHIALLAFVVGVACFSALGMLVAALAPSGDAAPAITNATLLPVAFISDVFIVMDGPPRWMEILGGIFPLRAFVQTFRAAFDPTVAEATIQWGSVGYIALWGVAAVMVAVKLFKWEPKAKGETRRSSRRYAAKGR